MSWDGEEELRIMTSVAPENAKCSACTRTSSESGEALFYTYSNGYNMIHKTCAELPKQIDHPTHPEHPLVLLAKPPYGCGMCECQVCKKSWRNFVYHCSSCEFDVDILCASLEDKDIVIPTHHHPMRLISRPASFKCNACDAGHEDNESYICTKPSCGFWIHKKCGSLPEMFKRSDHDHPLQVAISMPARYLKYKFTCEICQEDLGSNHWIYYCQRCKYFIHLKCIAAVLPSQKESNDRGVHPLLLVMIRELKTVVNQVLREDYFGERTNQEYLGQLDRRLPEVNADIHEHSLVLNSDHHRDEIICDGCIGPIDHASSPYYKCGQQCNFFLHTTCTALPKHRIHHYYYAHDLKLYFPKNPWEVVKCEACNSLCNGYVYKCVESGCSLSLDIKCCYLIGDITHIGHKHHLRPSVSRAYRHLLPHYGWSYHNYVTCSGCGGNHGNNVYLHCEACIFSLGYFCATLPATVKHRWDKHPLILSFPPHFRDSDTGGDDEFYCEVCEEEIHPKHWMYRCVECDQSFHPRCIPTLGTSRNIKFGKTCSIKRHPHRLTLVPQAKLTSLCHTCRKSLHWSRAFECDPCGFYLCPDCIPKEEFVVE